MKIVPSWKLVVVNESLLTAFDQVQVWEVRYEHRDSLL